MSNNKRQEIIFIGRRLNRSNKLSFRYKIPTTSETMTFSKKLLGTETVGAILEVELEEDGVRRPYVYKGHVDSRQDRLYKDTTSDFDGWVNADRLAYDEHQMHKQIKKKQPTYYDQAIDNLKFLYKNSPPTQKQIFINRLIRDITK